MLKRGTKVTLFSPETGRSASFEHGHAAAILQLQTGRKQPSWILPEGSKYIFEDGEIKSVKVRGTAGKSGR
jgi:hypothetical protein